MFTLPAPKRVTKHPLVTVCGSFNRHLRDIRLAVEELFDEGACVLSPLRPVTPLREHAPGFLLLDSDHVTTRTTVRSIEDQHLAQIRKSDFVLLICPDGHVGCAAAFEIGFTRANDTPVYATQVPRDLAMAALVTHVATVKLAVLNHQLSIL